MRKLAPIFTLFLVSCFSQSALSQSIQSVYVNPQKGCATSCLGTLDDPFDNLYAAMASV